MKTEYRKFVSQVFEERGKFCQVRSKVCTNIGQGLHHLQKRNKDNLMKKQNVLVCCNPCNQFIESNSKWAAENGFTISKFKPCN